MVLLELYLGVREGRASSLLPVYLVYLSQGPNPLHGCPGGFIYPTPRGTIVIRLGAGPSRLSLWPPPFLPASGARRLAGPADRLDTVETLLVTQAWSSGRGNSAAVYRAITVAIPRLI